MKVAVVSIEDSNAVDAYLKSALKEIFSDVDLEKFDTDKRAIISVNNVEVEFGFNLKSASVEYHFNGPDQSISLASERLTSKLSTPESVRGSHIFGKNDSDDDSPDSDEDGRSLSGVEAVTLLPAKLIVITVWFVIGLALWLQILMRTHLIVSAIMGFAALSGKHNKDVNKLIRYANTFWVRGFRNILNFGTKEAVDEQLDLVQSARTLILECLTSLIFYAGLYILFIKE